jgi:hypothetical protein
MAGERFALRRTKRRHARLQPECSETDMCEQCKELDAKIEHYQRVARNITDQKTIDGLNKLISDMQRKRAALHPEPSQDGRG